MSKKNKDSRNNKNKHIKNQNNGNHHGDKNQYYTQHVQTNETSVPQQQQTQETKVVEQNQTQETKVIVETTKVVMASTSTSPPVSSDFSSEKTLSSIHSDVKQLVTKQDFEQFSSQILNQFQSQQLLHQKNEEITKLKNDIEKLNSTLNQSTEKIQIFEDEKRKLELLKLKQEYKVSDSETDRLVELMKKLHSKIYSSAFDLETELNIEENETVSTRFQFVLSESLFRVCSRGVQQDVMVREMMKMLSVLFPQVVDTTTTQAQAKLNELVSNTSQLCKIVGESSIPKFVFDWTADPGKICVLPAVSVSNTSAVIIPANIVNLQ